MCYALFNNKKAVNSDEKLDADLNDQIHHWLAEDRQHNHDRNCQTAREVEAHLRPAEL
jgi:hypothetical protein